MSATAHQHIDHPYATGRRATSPAVPSPARPRPASAPLRPLPYAVLLDRAYQLGWADGRLAGDLGLPEDPTAPAASCRTGDPVGFARTLWAARPGRPPSGLTLNAAHWYGQGFRDGLANASAPDPPPVR
jgi:hypothetical protein